MSDDLQARKNFIEDTIKEYEKAIRALQMELFKIQGDELGLEIGKMYSVTDVFCKIFTRIPDDQVKLIELSKDSDSDSLMCTFATSKYTVDIEANVVEDYICLQKN